MRQLDASYSHLAQRVAGLLQSGGVPLGEAPGRRRQKPGSKRPPRGHPGAGAKVGGEGGEGGEVADIDIASTPLLPGAADAAGPKKKKAIVPSQVLRGRAPLGLGAGSGNPARRQPCLGESAPRPTHVCPACGEAFGAWPDCLAHLAAANHLAMGEPAGPAKTAKTKSTARSLCVQAALAHNLSAAAAAAADQCGGGAVSGEAEESSGPAGPEAAAEAAPEGAPRCSPEERYLRFGLGPEKTTVLRLLLVWVFKDQVIECCPPRHPIVLREYEPDKAAAATEKVGGPSPAVLAPPAKCMCAPPRSSCFCLRGPPPPSFAVANGL